MGVFIAATRATFVVFRSPWFVFSHIFITFDKHSFTDISMVICKIGWSIRSWLSDYISFSFYKSYCRHDMYWILVAFMIAASALIKVSRLYGLYRHLYTQLIYWHCAVILYTHVNLLNKRSWILNPEFRPCMGLLSARCSSSGGSTWRLQSAWKLPANLTSTSLNIPLGKWKRGPW